MTTFHWPRLDRSSWLLAGFIFLSLILHSAAFFLFQAFTPIRPPAARPSQPVQFLTPFDANGRPSPENQALLAWIAAEDPAVVARVPDAPPPDMLSANYRPSYNAMRTAPLGVPEDPSNVQYPSARDAIALILSNDPLPIPPAPPVEPQTTRVAFSSELAARTPKIAFSPKAKAANAVEATRILIGVNASGEVRFTFPQQPSSGDPALDAEAERFVRTLQFAPANGGDVAWGFATFHWGDDATGTK